MIRIRNVKDFWAGALYLVAGLSAVGLASDYHFGTLTRMGPGYFPTLLGAILAMLGAASLARSFVSVGEALPAIAWRPLLAVIGGTAAFALLLTRAGLPMALLALILIAASVSQHFRLGWRPLLAMLGLIVFCVVVFRKLLGVPLPLLGSWFVG